MPFSIELFFDPKSSMAVHQCGEALEAARIPSIFSTLGAAPHVSLAVFQEYNPTRLHATLKKLAAGFPATHFSLASFGTFPGREGVLFLVPVVTPTLLEIHDWLHRALLKTVDGSWVYYQPGHWMPHCTLCLRLNPKKLVKGLEVLKRRAYPIRGRYSCLALVETHPVHIKPIRLIYSIPFSGQKRRNP